MTDMGKGIIQKDQPQNIIELKNMVIGLSNKYEEEIVIIKVRSMMKELYIVYHVEEVDEYPENLKTLGVFDSKEKAEAAIQVLKIMPEFAGREEEFTIGDTDLNATYWLKGYSSAL
ncbi:hypothetical protein O4H49_14350 [Kiloniella laminariae]|uniref:DUF7336 domain-containing protein n=1 Tax=Kiloniella laminariae TaxID=454162 RepID=A0ABT4LLM1_9PROT|nr:hypothetical protein [Kiloniella laminariae]MCZ4281969.1 hypothetical protein [Kiloniella laminariae]